MCQFIESICCIDGLVFNLEEHQKRINRTFAKFFNDEPFLLSDLFTGLPQLGKYKCRVIYNQTANSIEFVPYVHKKIDTLKIIHADDLDYDFKYFDRTGLDKLFSKRKDADDIIIIKNGYITDSSYANLAFFDGNKWFTPSNPLLKGTKREKYLKESILVEKDILINDINKYEKVSLINAMLDLSEVEVSISRTSL